MSGAVTRHALRVYAALAELKAGPEEDVLDALVPFFEPILSVMNGRIFDPHLFATGVRKLYRWRFTGDIASRFVPRLERKGFLQRRAGTSEGAVWIVTYQPAAGASNHISIEGIVENIIDEFEKFPPRVTDLLTYQRTRDQLKDMLIRFLVSMDRYGEGAYSPELGHLDPGGEASDLLAGLEEGGRPLEPADRYMCARFVRHLMDRRPEYAAHLTRLASIALLTEVVEDFLKPTEAETRSDLIVALDAPLALDYLGCSGKALQDDIGTLVGALRKIGVSFIVFPDSCVEMQRNLRSMLANQTDQRHGYTHTAMVRGETTKEFVTAVANNPERALQQAGVTVRQMTLDSLPSSHRFFDNERHEDFFSSIWWPATVAAREHDATCLALVVRIREGRNASDIFKSKVVLVTRNSTFVKHARKYCLESRIMNEVQEGPVIHQRELATTAWLRTGLGGDDAIPRGHLIATCDRVLQVRPEVRQALAAQLAKLTPERLQQFGLLMQDSRSIQKLADETLNNESVISEANAERLLDAMREATATELQDRFDAALAEERAVRSSEQLAAQTEIEALQEELQRKTLSEAKLRERQYENLRQQMSEVNTTARRVEIVTVGLLLALGAVGVADYFTEFLRDSWVWKGMPAAAGVIGIYHMIMGVIERPAPGLSSLLNWMTEKTLRNRLKKWGLLETYPMERLLIRNGRAKLSHSPTDNPPKIE